MLRIEEQGEVLRVWLSRPNSLNALDHGTLEELAEVYVGLQRRFGIKVVVLAGEGRSFCAGADLRDRPGVGLGSSERERRWSMMAGQRACAAIETCPAVTVARLHGHVYGGGLALAMACDFRVASDDAEFCYPEVGLGAPLTWGAVPRLIHEIGAARARELVQLCRMIDAATAERYGVVHDRCPVDELDETVATLVDAALDKPDLALQMAKDQFRVAAQRGGGLAPDFDADLMGVAVAWGGVTRWT